MGRQMCPGCGRLIKTYAYAKGWYFKWHKKPDGTVCPRSETDTKKLAPEGEAQNGH